MTPTTALAPRLSFAIMGAGAVGCYFGALLAQGRYLGDAVADGLGGVHGIFGRIDTVQRNISQIAF